MEVLPLQVPELLSLKICHPSYIEICHLVSSQVDAGDNTGSEMPQFFILVIQIVKTPCTLPIFSWYFFTVCVIFFKLSLMIILSRLVVGPVLISHFPFYLIHDRLGFLRFSSNLISVCTCWLCGQLLLFV